VTRVLLTGAGSPASQNILRALREADHEYYIVGADANYMHLEWGDFDEVYVSPLAGEPHYPEFLVDLCLKEKIDFLHGNPDWEVARLVTLEKSLPVSLFLPSKTTIEICQDKYASGLVWHRSTPQLRDDCPMIIESRRDLEMAAEELGMPFWLRATKGAGAIGSCRVDNLEKGDAWRTFWTCNGTVLHFMAQEYLPGREYAFQSIWQYGKLLVSAARERLEFIFPQHAPSGVTSSPVVAVSRHNDDVNEAATAAVEAVCDKPHGIFSVDLREDKYGTPRPTEINAGRFFTTSLFMARAGCNMPHIYVQIGRGCEPGPGLKQYNAIPEGLYWLRHIDCNQVLLEEGKWRAKR
jgi:carbamoyl-phosphate synthase large subunit